MPGSAKCSFPLKFSYQHYVYIYHIPVHGTWYMPLLPHHCVSCVPVTKQWRVRGRDEGNPRMRWVCRGGQSAEGRCV